MAWKLVDVDSDPIRSDPNPGAAFWGMPDEPELRYLHTWRCSSCRALLVNDGEQPTDACGKCKARP